MLTLLDPIQTTEGVVLYRDDSAPERFYVLPLGLAPRRNAQGHSDFTLLFYQSDFAERGARLNACFTPLYPAVHVAAVPELAALGDRASVEGVSFLFGAAELLASGLPAQPDLGVDAAAGRIRTELSLPQESARSLLLQLPLASESVRLQTCLAYAVATPPMSALLRVDLRATHAALWQAGGGSLSYGRLCQLLQTLPDSALRVEPISPSRGQALPLSEEQALTVAPLLCRQLAAIDAGQPLFLGTTVALREAAQIPEGELTLDLRRPRSRAAEWRSEWSLSAFYSECVQAGRLAEYFPQVLHLPPVGTVQLLIENRLPIDNRCIDKVSVKVRHRRLGSLEESVFETHFASDTPPVAQCAIPRIAMTEFAYHYQAQIRLAEDDPTHPGQRLIPKTPAWRLASQPILQVGAPDFPFALAYLRASPEIFSYVARADIEVAAADDGEPQPLLTVSLSPQVPYRWGLLDPVRFAGGRLRWRAVLHADAAGGGRAVKSAWQAENSLAATVTLSHVYPQRARRIVAQAQFSDLVGVQGVTCQFLSGAPPSGDSQVVAGLQATLLSEDSRVIHLWPQSIFEEGFSYRYRVEGAGAELGFTDWRHQASDEVIMAVADDFYATRTIRAALRAPWSLRGGPDPATRDAEILFAELHVRTPSTADQASESFTFDNSNRGAEVAWTLRQHRGEGRVQLEILVLTADGRMLTFGPYETAQDRIQIEIYRRHVSDSDPAEFDVRWSSQS